MVALVSRRLLAFIPALLLLAAALASPTPVRAGAFVFAGESNGVDAITHSIGYNGAGGTITVSVCIDPTSANAAAMEIPVQNVVKTWNDRIPTTGNLLLGSSNDVPSGQIDFESVALHEVGHCVPGLAHVNLASESGLTGSDQNYTKSTDGANNSHDINAGADGVRGSSDDVRGDDVNLHWFRTSNNDPFTIAPTVDSTTYSRDLADLPGGHLFATNADRSVSSLLGAPNTEAAMQQGTFTDEDQRRLNHDDVATALLGMAGLDEIAGTSDDYTLELSYAGLTTGCDIVIDFDNTETGFAVCQTSGTFLPGGHIAITAASIFFNTGSNWYFNPNATSCGDGTLDPGEQCDDSNMTGGDCCSASCQFESSGSACQDGDACTDADTCDGAGTCDPGGPTVCDDGLFCSGVETCDSLAGCQAGTPVVCDDTVGCTSDVCNEGTDSCDYTPIDSVCDDSLFCNGVETCDPVLDCQAGIAACAPLACDEVLDICGCSTDEDCDDTLFCNGTETCAGGFCSPGTPVVCDDAVGCTDDACNEGTDSCDFAPNDGNCDDALFCNGAETCSAVSDCQTSAPVVCDDAVGCTDDACNEGTDSCDFVPNDGYCDDALFCNGAELCSAVSDCQAGGDPCVGQLCSESGDVCEPLPVVTFEEVETGTSSSSSTVSTSADLTAVDDELYLAAVSYRSNVGVSNVSGLGLTWSLLDEQCSGQDSTGVSLWSAQGLPSGDGPVTATLTGSASRAVIAVTRYSDVSPSDPFSSVISGNTNGIEGACSSGPNSSSYSFDQSISANNSLAYGAVARRNRSHTPGAGYSERADEQSGPGGQAAGLAVEDRSVPTPTTLAIDGSFSGSTDWAFVGLELKAALPECIDDLECGDGLFCNGVETCDAGSCQPGTPVVCGDAVGCTDDACNEVTDSCDNTPNDGLCDDALFCSGTETCDALADCQPGTPVVCGDAVSCTDDACNEATDSCDNTPNDGLCDDALFCSGTETCDALADCQPGTPVVCDDAVSCTDDACNEVTDSCDATPVDTSCGDGNVCTTDVCDPVLDCQNEPIAMCQAPVPATSSWGTGALVLLMLAFGCLLLRRPAPNLK